MFSTHVIRVEKSEIKNNINKLMVEAGGIEHSPTTALT
jgi:hypothetical protein